MPLIPAPNYNAFYAHLKVYKDLGIPVGPEELVKLARQYNCPLPDPKNTNY